MLMRIFILIFAVFLPFQNFGQRLFNFKVGENYGYKNANNVVVIPAQYEYPADFINGFALIMVGDYGIIILDTSGRQIFSFSNSRNNPNEYNHQYSEGMLAVYDSLSSRYGFIDTNGKIRIAPKFYEVQDFHNGLAAIWENPDIHVDEGSGCGTPVLHSKWGFINMEGEFIVPCEYEEPGKIENGIIVFEKNAEPVYYNLDGTLIKNKN